jgi:hypothetical protein
MYLKNIIKDEPVQLLDILPKLKKDTLYNISVYQKYNGIYYNTTPTHYILFISNNKSYLFKPKKVYFSDPNHYYYKIIDDVNIDGELSMKIVVNEAETSLYKININNIKSLYVCSKYSFPIYNEIDKVLKKYKYNIIDIKTDCTIENKIIVESEQINEIFVDVEIIKEKPLYKRLFSIIFNKKFIKSE